MPKRTSKKVTHSEPVSKLSEKTKQTSASMLNFNQAAPKALEQTDGAVDGVLGKIYQLMVDIRKDELDQRKKDESINQTDLKKEEQRHQELLKALTVRRRPKPKRVIRREKKAEEKEAAKPTEPPKKPTEPAKKPAEAAKKPDEAAKKPAEDTAKKAAEDKAKKAAEDKAKKEAEDRTKKAAEDKAKKEAEDRTKKAAEDKAKKSAEQVKPPEVKPPPKAEAAPAAPKPAQVKPPPKAEAIKPPPKVPPAIGGSKGLVIASLLAAGFSSTSMANVLANVEKESGFNPRSEEVPKAEKIFSMFGGPAVKANKKGELVLNQSGNLVRFPTLQDAKDIVAAGPEAYFNKVYDGRMGNDKPGDGYKYRGRGFIQITGKSMYRAVSKEIGEDLVSNPDLANEPKTAAKIIPAFFKIKMREGKKTLSDLEDIDVVNAQVGSADAESRKQRKILAEKYKAEVSSTPVPSSDTGTKVDQSSKENADLKEKLNKDKSAQTTNNTTTTNNQTNNVKPEQKVDDRPPHVRKQQQ